MCKRQGVRPFAVGALPRPAKPKFTSAFNNSERCPRKVATWEWRELSRRTRCAAFHRCLSAASSRDAARLRGVLRVLREWVLARSAPASPLARACALHLLCRDAGFLHDAGMMSWPGCVLSAACDSAYTRALRVRCGSFRSRKLARVPVRLLCIAPLLLLTKHLSSACAPQCCKGVVSSRSCSSVSPTSFLEQHGVPTCTSDGDAASHLRYTRKLQTF